MCSLPEYARVAKSADATDLKSVFRQRECGFKSRPGHQILKDLYLNCSILKLVPAKTPTTDWPKRKVLKMLSEVHSTAAVSTTAIEKIEVHLKGPVRGSATSRIT